MELKIQEYTDALNDTSMDSFYMQYDRYYVDVSPLIASNTTKNYMDLYMGLMESYNSVMEAQNSAALA